MLQKSKSSEHLISSQLVIINSFHKCLKMPLFFSVFIKKKSIIKQTNNLPKYPPCKFTNYKHRGFNTVIKQ